MTAPCRLGLVCGRPPSLGDAMRLRVADRALRSVAPGLTTVAVLPAGAGGWPSGWHPAPAGDAERLVLVVPGPAVPARAMDLGLGTPRVGLLAAGCTDGLDRVRAGLLRLRGELPRDRHVLVGEASDPDEVVLDVDDALPGPAARGSWGLDDWVAAAVTAARIEVTDPLLLALRAGADAVGPTASAELHSEVVALWAQVAEVAASLPGMSHGDPWSAWHAGGLRAAATLERADCARPAPAPEHGASVRGALSALRAAVAARRRRP